MPLDDQPQDPPFPVVTDSKPWENVSPEARRDAERDAIAAVLAMLDPEAREQVRRLLAGEGLPPGAGAGFAGASDPELARLLGIISSIRWAELESRMAPVHENPPAETLIRVQIALVPDLIHPDVRATVIRRRRDRGRPLLLLREHDLTVTDLEIGLNEAVLSVRLYGETPETDRTLHVGAEAAPRNPRLTTNHIELVKAADRRNVDGVGFVRTTIVLTPLDRSAR